MRRQHISITRWRGCRLSEFALCLQPVVHIVSVFAATPLIKCVSAVGNVVWRNSGPHSSVTFRRNVRVSILFLPYVSSPKASQYPQARILINPRVSKERLYRRGRRSTACCSVVATSNALGCAVEST